MNISNSIPYQLIQNIFFSSIKITRIKGKGKKKIKEIEIRNQLSMKYFI